LKEEIGGYGRRKEKLQSASIRGWLNRHPCVSILFGDSAIGNVILIIAAGLMVVIF
jgi:hypothetical protein